MRYYVYILLDDMIKGRYDNEYCSIEYRPFYVGKGDSKSKNKTERHLKHYKETKQNLTKIVNPHKFNKIKKLQENGFEPNFLIIYDSVTDAAEAINGNPSTITQVCKGKRKKHRNLTFKYV